MIKTNVSKLFILIIIIYFSSTLFAQQEHCDFPDLNQLKHANMLGGPPDTIIIGKVLKIRRMPVYKQNIIKHISVHSSYYYSFYTTIYVKQLIIIDKTGYGYYPTIGKDVKVALEANIIWQWNKHPFKIFTTKSTSKINYLKKNFEYLFILIYASDYRGKMYKLYRPKDNISISKCENFYVWPMLIDGDMIEVPVQYYGSDEIIRKKFKKEEILNLYRDQQQE